MKRDHDQEFSRSPTRFRLADAFRWASVAGVVVVSLAGMAAAVALDVACKLDCPPDDDVTWADALGGAGTGLSPPAFLLGVLVAVAALGGRPRAWGLVGLVAQLLLAALMLVAGFLDASTMEALRGEHGAVARVLSVLLFLAVISAGASATFALLRRRGGRAQS